MDDKTKSIIDTLADQIDKGYWKGEELRKVLDMVHALGFAEGSVFGAQAIKELSE